MSGPAGDGLTGDQLRSLLFGYAVAGRVVADPVGTLALARENLRRMRENAARGAALRWFDEWERLLDGPLLELLEALTSPSPLSRELRQNTPFAGVLSEDERHRVREVFRQLDDAHDVALIRARVATDSGRHVDLDEVITALGYDQAELEAELNAEHDADGEHPGVVPPGRPMPAPGRSSTPPLDDWSF